MAVPVVSDYTGLITSQHATKQKFMATVKALVQPAVDNQNVLAFLASHCFDLDEAVGVQLDQIGLWVGRSREVQIPLSGVYFSLDTVNLGFDQGNWQGPFDAATGVTLLDDTTYRALLRAKIIMNHWDGSAVQAASAINKLFGSSPGTFATVQDNQDMTMTVGVSGVVPSAALISMLQNGEFDVQPVGVGINYLITSVNTTALFGFDVETSAIAGFDVGSWSGQPGTTPGQVTGFALAASSANTATFTWIAPLTGTGPYTYQLQYKVTGTGPFVLAPVTSSTTQTISGLASAQSYTVQVYAISSGGPGPSSTAIIFSTSGGVPAQVTGLQETASSPSSISLLWNAVAGAVSYQVMYRQTGSSVFLTGPVVSSTSATVSGLLNATVYDFQVFAANTSGAGNASAILSVGTSGSTPGNVVGLATTAIGQTDIAITWLNPVTGNGPFAFIVHYAVNSVPISYQPFTGPMALTALGGSCDITGLLSGVDYLIQVAATNAGGTGNFSTALAATTLAGPPNQVTGLVSSVINPTSVVLNWVAVTNAVQYQVQFRSAGATIWVNGPLVTAPTLTATVTGLAAGATYQFRVYAIGP